MNSSQPSISSLKRAFLPLLAAVLAATTHAGNAATTRTWTDTTGDNIWATAGNWDISGTPVATDTLIFDTLTSGVTSPITVGSNSIGKIIEFGATSSSSTTLAFTLGTAAHPGTLTFSTNAGTGANLTANILYQGSSTATQTINSDIVTTYGGAIDLNIANTNTSGVLTINGNISNSAPLGGSIVVKGSGNINLNGTLGGAVGTGNLPSTVLTVAMTSGTVTITGSNTAPTGNLALGNTNYSGGNVLIRTSNPWGSTSSNLLNLAAGATGTFQLQGTVANPNLTLPNGFNTAVVRAAGTAGGAAHIENISGNNSLGSLAFGPGISTNGYLNIQSDAGSTLTVAGVVDNRTGSSASGVETVLFYGAGNGVVSGAISDSVTVGDTVAVAKDGTGTWILAGNNTNTGGTTISGGTLQVGNGSNSGSLGSGGVSNNGVLKYNRTDTVTENNVITGNGSVSQSGTGTTIFTQANGYSGGTVINSGTFQVSNTTGSATGSGGVGLGAATLTGTGIISGAVTANGAGSIITPGTTSSVGNLSLGGVQSFAGLTLNFAINGTGTTLSTLTLGSGGLVSTGGTLTFNLYDLGQGTLAADTAYTLITSTGSLSAGSIAANIFGGGFTLKTSYGTNGILFSGNTATFELQAVPEPGTWGLLLAGLAMVIFLQKRRTLKTETL